MSKYLPVPHKVRSNFADKNETYFEAGIFFSLKFTFFKKKTNEGVRHDKSIIRKSVTIKTQW
jgi:hypothetical protein